MAETNFQKNFRLQLIVSILGLLIMGAKFAAWLLTNSNAILTDALESIINVVAGFFGLYSLSLASKPKDVNHPYGHGKIEFISAGFEGGLIFLAGFLIMAKAGYNLIYPQVISQIDLGLILVAGPGLANFIMGWLVEKQGRKSGSLILQASGKHLKSDAYSSAGLLAGLFLLFLSGQAWLDNAVALLFSGIILYTGFRLMRTSIAGIMDEADYQLISSIVEFLDQHRTRNWIDIHNFRVIKYGATLHIDCHLTVPYYFLVKEAHDEIKTLEAAISQFCAVPVELFIHIDPCEPPEACKICHKADCGVREAPFEQHVPWELENIMKNQQHY